MEEAILTSEMSDGVLTFYIKGEIDHHTARGIRERMDEDIYYYRSPEIIVDLSNVSFMDSSGLGLLLGRYTKAKDLGCALVLREPTAEIMRILALAGANKLFSIEKSEKNENDRLSGNERKRGQGQDAGRKKRPKKTPICSNDGESGEKKANREGKEKNEEKNDE